MAVRPSMSALISRVRLRINDPAGASQTFTDQDIQNILDESRVNVRYLALAPSPTYSGSTLLYLDYFSDYGGWEDDVALFQYLTIPVTPTSSENIVGHFTFAQTTFPPVFATGKLYDVFRASADLLEGLAAQWMLSYNTAVDGQTFQRSQAQLQILALAKTYRMKQRPVSSAMTRSDLLNTGPGSGLGLSPHNIDFYASGNGR